jgi:transketolase
MTEHIAAREAYGLALLELGKQRSDFVVLEADLSASTRTVYFGEEFPERYYDCGVAEMNMMGMAAGLAASGITAVANTFSVFSSMKTCEQVRTFICYPDLNVKIVSTHAGLDVGEAGVTHQAIEDVAIMRAFPNMKVISPADGLETATALKTMLETPGPAYLRLGRSDLPDIHPEGYEFQFGHSVHLRDGSDVTIIATGIAVGFALDAAGLLADSGISSGVINMSSLKPVDQGALSKVSQSSRLLVTVEDHSIIGGLGSAVLEALAEHPGAPVLRLGLQDVFGESGKPEDLFSKYQIDAHGISAQVKNYLANMGS